MQHVLPAQLFLEIAVHAFQQIIDLGLIDLDILGAAFVERFRGRLLNIPPSLLPKHKGLHTHARALEAGDAEHE